MLAGAGAGLTSAVVTSPLDVIKTKLQAPGKLQPGIVGYHGLTGTLARIWREERVPGLFRGIGPSLLAYLPTWGIYFTVYDRVKEVTIKKYGEERWLPHIISAMTAGASGTIVTSPLWVIKTRFMAYNVRPDSNIAYRHTWDALHQIVATEGFKGLYRGLIPSLFGVSHVAVQFPLYEQLKRLYRPQDGSDIPPSTILACSSASKVVASVLCYPHEVVRTRLQIQRAKPIGQGQQGPQPGGAGSPPPLPVAAVPGDKAYAGVLQTIRNIIAEEGARGFYVGLGVNLVRTVPASAMTILTYELLMRKLTRLTAPSI